MKAKFKDKIQRKCDSMHIGCWSENKMPFHSNAPRVPVHCTIASAKFSDVQTTEYMYENRGGIYGIPLIIKAKFEDNVIKYARFHCILVSS